MKIELPKQVKKALDLLEVGGYEAYIVGGCVRDCLMDKKPYDWDITTSAKPHDTAKVFKNFRVIETGIKHGTVTVLIEGMPIEITTFRVDGEYSDSRHPDNVVFTKDLVSDLSRRDFTVNALAYSPKSGLVDAFDGLSDVRNKIIRCVGEPDIRFNEDALRILRALRFSSVLGFNIEKNTSDSLLKNMKLLGKISAERIQHELIKLICGIDVERVLLDFRQVFFEFIPELAPTDGFDQHDSEKHIYTVYEHIAHAVSVVKAEPHLRMAMLLHDLGKPSTFKLDENDKGTFENHAEVGADIALEVLQRLRFSKRFTQKVVTLVRYHDLKVFEQTDTLPSWLGKLGEDFIRDYIHIKKADLLSLSPKMAAKAAKVDELEGLLNRLLEEGPCLSLKDLKINGGDIIGLGVPPTSAVGDVLGKLFDLVLTGEIENTRDSLMNEARRILAEM
ncbi:MAG TPA: HD domain-containing protein [Clostridiales bacterium]|nr:HD domain-containing protein [Clostridiales bacterium]